MPFIRVTVTPAPSPETSRRLAEGVTGLMADILGKQAHLTSVLVEGASGLWSIGADAVHAAAHIEALVTAGTNDAPEKAAFLEHANALLRRELGTLPEATYVVVRDVPAGDWGYDGHSQAARRRTP